MRTARLLGLAIAALIIGSPLLLLLMQSFGTGWFWPKLLPAAWSARGWSYLWTSPAIRDASVKSLTIALAVTALSVLIALPAGRALASTRLIGRQAIFFCLLMPVLAPPLASAMGVHSLVLRSGWADTMLAVVAVHLIPAAPYCTLLLAASFLRMDSDLELLAQTLGATPGQVWLHVILPSIAPGVATAAGFAFLLSWSQYLLTSLIGGGAVQTLPLFLVAFQRASDTNVASALTLVFTAPALAVLFGFSRFLQENNE